MTKSKLVKALNESLSKKMMDYGYALTNGNFYYKFNNDAIFFIENRILKLTASNEIFYQFDPSIFVHWNAIEDIYKKITENKSLQEKFDFITVGNRIYNLEHWVTGKRPPDLRYNFVPLSFEEVDQVSEKLFQKIKDVAIVYVEKNSRLKNIENILNEKPLEYCLHMQNETYRIIKGIIAAHLLEGNSEYYKKLVEIYRTKIFFMDLLTKKEFENVINYLS